MVFPLVRLRHASLGIMLCHVAGASLSPPAPVAIARPTPDATDAPASPSAVAACEGLLPTPEIRRTVCGARGPRAVLVAVEAGGLNAHDAHTVGSWMITAWDPRTAISAVLRSPAKHSSNYTCALVHGGLWHAIALLGALPETWLALCGDDLEPYQLFECAQGLGKASFLCAIWSSRHASRLSPRAEPAVRNDERVIESCRSNTTRRAGCRGGPVARHESARGPHAHSVRSS